MVPSALAQHLRRSWIRPRCRALTTSSAARTQVTVGKRERRPSQKLPTSPARTRFAPSPTGHLHLGSLRTALFNFLLAKATEGQFLLRVEDTDQKRTVSGAEERMYQDLRWAGLQWDEGPDIGGPYGPYKQSERAALYQEHAEKLLQSGHAYRCFCTPERVGSVADFGPESCLRLLKEESDERASKFESYVVRLKMPPMERGFTDLVYGMVGGRKGPPKANTVQGQACHADPVLLKSDRYPTYHLANVVDDHYMEITHVIRAAEWMSSTPKHVVIYEAFGWQPPLYAHVGLLQNIERQKYSKRKGHTDLDIRSLKAKGFFPEALVNYVALHGWSHNIGDDFLKVDDLIKNFDLKFTKGNTVVVPTKLDYLQKRYAERYVEERGAKFEDMVEKTLAIAEDELQLGERKMICSNADLRQRITKLLQLEARKYSFPQEFFDSISYFFFSEPRQGDYRNHVHWLVLEHLTEIKERLLKLSREEWSVSFLNQAIIELQELMIKSDLAKNNDDLKMKIKSQLQSFLRWTLSYGHPGPTIAQTMEILGRDVTIKRLEEAVASLKCPTRETEDATAS